MCKFSHNKVLPQVGVFGGKIYATWKLLYFRSPTSLFCGLPKGDAFHLVSERFRRPMLPPHSHTHTSCLARAGCLLLPRPDFSLHRGRVQVPALYVAMLLNACIAGCNFVLPIH